MLLPGNSRDYFLLPDATAVALAMAVPAINTVFQPVS